MSKFSMKSDQLDLASKDIFSQSDLFNTPLTAQNTLKASQFPKALIENMGGRQQSLDIAKT